ncbi:MAG: putative metal-binding motif-containing protein [Nannocystaceae bacterium]
MIQRLRAPSTLSAALAALLLGACGDDGTGVSEGSASTTDDTTGTTASTTTTTSTTASESTTSTTTGSSASASTSTSTSETGTTTSTSTTEPATTGVDPTTDTTVDTTTDTTTDTTEGDPDADMDGVPASEDCDDADPLNFPGNTEVCDGQDNDCDGDADGGAVDAKTYYSDMDKDGYGVDEASTIACAQPPDTSEVGGDCNDNDPDAYPDADNVCPLGASCKTIFDSGIAGDDGLYLIDPDGVDAGEAPLEVWCDMVNGGLTAALIINSVNEGTYIGDFGAGYVSTAKLAVDPAVTSSANAMATQAWLDLNAFGYDELWLASYDAGAAAYMSEAIKRTDLRINFGEDGYLLYNDPNGYYWCGGDKAYADAGIGQVNQPMGAPADCKGHTSLGSGWDFSLVGGVGQYNQGLTLCGGDASTWMYAKYGATMIFYPNTGAAHVVWVR